jgi:hypothetical protein
MNLRKYVENTQKYCSNPDNGLVPAQKNQSEIFSQKTTTIYIRQFQNNEVSKCKHIFLPRVSVSRKCNGEYYVFP